MKKVWIAWMLLAVLSIPFAAACAQSRLDAVYAFLFSVETGTYLVEEMPGLEGGEVDPETILKALVDRQEWPVVIRSVRMESGDLFVDLAEGSYPAEGAGSIEESDVLHSMAKTLLANIEGALSVYYTIEEKPYVSGHFSFDGAAYMTIIPPREAAPRIDKDVYNPNIEADSQRYIDPQTPLDEHAPLDDLSHVSQAEYALEDDDFLYDTVYDAFPLIELIVNCTDAHYEFTGGPGGEIAWEAIRTFLIRYSQQDGGALDFGLRNGWIQARNVTAVYDALFAYGRIPEQPETAVPLMVREGEAYYVEDYSEDSIRFPTINAISAGSGSDIQLDISVHSRGANGVERFLWNATLTLQPDQYALYGARLTGFWMKEGSPSFTGVEVSGSEEDLSRTQVEEATRMLDGVEQTFWAFGAGTNLIATFTTDRTQTVRGVSLLPFNAQDDQEMMNFGRVKRIRLTLSDGNIFEKEFSTDFLNVDQWVDMPFEGVHQVGSISLEIVEHFPGQVHESVCISEVQFY